MSGSRKEHFYVFCAILGLVVALFSIGAWSTYSRMAGERSLTSQFARRGGEGVERP